MLFFAKTANVVVALSSISVSLMSGTVQGRLSFFEKEDVCPEALVTTCTAQSYDGFFNLSGVEVYCQERQFALIQNFDASECSSSNVVGQLNESRGGQYSLSRVGLNSCGYLSDSAVRKIAKYSRAVVLQDNLRGLFSSQAPEVLDALRNGRNWYGTEDLWETPDKWCFDSTQCTQAEIDAMDGWPRMYRSCRRPCVQWTGSLFSRDLVSPPGWSRTFLQMKDVSEICKSSQTTTVLKNIIENPSLTRLSGFVSITELVNELLVPGPFTIFAPSDQAFDALDPELRFFLQKDNAALSSVLRYHVVQANALSSTLQSNQVLETLNGEGVEVTVSGAVVKVNNATVVVADALADNGVVHVIDQVLLPPSIFNVSTDEETVIPISTAAQPLCGFKDVKEVDTCFAQPEGDYSIGGRHVFCRNDHALIQNYVSDFCEVPFLPSTRDGRRITKYSPPEYGAVIAVSTNSCGYLPRAVVEKLAESATGIELTDLGRGSARSDAPEVLNALRTGKSWHGTENLWTMDEDEGICFDASKCTQADLEAINYWPRMYLSCQSPNCAHWTSPVLGLAGYVHSSQQAEPSIASQTWLKMGPVKAPSSDTCSGKTNGYYTIASIERVYCLDGAALLSQSCPTTTSYKMVDGVGPENCGFMDPESVRQLAKFAFGVNMTEDGSSASNIDGSAVAALRAGKSWQNDCIQWITPDDGSWCFETNCAISQATGWPNMYHSCGRRDCVHWLASVQQSRKFARATASRTLLLMHAALPPTPIPQSPTPVPSPTTTTEPTTLTLAPTQGPGTDQITECDSARTCFGKSSGMYTFSGTGTVFCDGAGAALIQNFVASPTQGGQYGALMEVQPFSSGYFNDSAVRRLAEYANAVRVVVVGQGSATSGAAAARALRLGKSWHQPDITWKVIDSLCFEAPCDVAKETAVASWPNMHASCRDKCVHWTADSQHSSSKAAPTIASRTWIEMTECQVQDPVDAISPSADTRQMGLQLAEGDNITSDNKNTNQSKSMTLLVLTAVPAVCCAMLLMIAVCAYRLRKRDQKNNNFTISPLGQHKRLYDDEKHDFSVVHMCNTSPSLHRTARPESRHTNTIRDFKSSFYSGVLLNQSTSASDRM